MEDLGAAIEPVTVPMIDDAVGAWGNLFVAECLLAHGDSLPGPRPGLQRSAAPVPGTGLRPCREPNTPARTSPGSPRAAAVSLLFDAVDVLALPTMGRLPPSLAEFPPSGIIPQEAAGALLSFTAPFALTGHPAISVPCGFSGDGLPIGLQLVGPHDCEALLLRVAGAYERATNWSDRRPPVD